MVVSRIWLLRPTLTAGWFRLKSPSLIARTGEVPQARACTYRKAAYVIPSPRGKGHLTRQASKMSAESRDEAPVSTFTHTNCGTAMPHTQCRGAWMCSRFKPPSVTRGVRLLSIKWLQILWEPVLCVLVRQWSLDSNALLGMLIQPFEDA